MILYKNFDDVLLDFDDTLYSEEAYFVEVFSSALSMSRVELNLLFQDFQAVRRAEHDIFRYYLGLIGEPSPAAHQALFTSYLNIEVDLEPAKGAQSLVDAFLSRGKSLAVLTNGIVGAQENKWNCLKLANKASVRFLPSRSIGLDKPSAETFEAARRLHGLDWNKTLAIGDRSSDIDYPASKGALSLMINLHNIRNKFVESFTLEEALEILVDA